MEDEEKLPDEAGYEVQRCVGVGSSVECPLPGQRSPVQEPTLLMVSVNLELPGLEPKRRNLHQQPPLSEQALGS
jgi:hypothetical protein